MKNSENSINVISLPIVQSYAREQGIFPVNLGIYLGKDSACVHDIIYAQDLKNLNPRPSILTLEFILSQIKAGTTFKEARELLIVFLRLTNSSDTFATIHKPEDLAQIKVETVIVHPTLIRKN